MDGNDNRQEPRNSLIIVAELRVDGLAFEHRIKVRNLSEGGMMGEGKVGAQRGSSVEVNLRNIGWVAGTVAWVQDTRFGVAFLDPIDLRLLQASATS